MSASNADQGRSLTRCLAVVDGALILTELGPVAYADVVPPRIGMPGSAYLRTVNQRLVQDQDVVIVERAVSPDGSIVADVWLGETHVNAVIAEALGRVDA